jgi:hypothetical protein
MKTSILVQGSKTVEVRVIMDFSTPNKPRNYPLSLAYWFTVVFSVLSSIGNQMIAAADDYIAPDLVKVTTTLYKASLGYFQPRFGTYEYTVGWEGIPAASCSLSFKDDGKNFIVETAARTYSAVDLLYRLRYDATAILSKDDLTSIKLTINHRENSRHKLVDIDFLPDGGRISAVRSKGVDDPHKIEVSFIPHNFTLDPIAAAFIARALPWEVNETKIFDVFNGKSRYYIELTAVRRETIRHNGEEKKVIVITPQVRNLTTTKPISKLREAFIYVTDDPHREVLKIVSSVFIGSVTTSLESFTPFASNHDNFPQRAQASPSHEMAVATSL